MTLDFTRVQTQGLVKVYGTTRALAGVDLCFGAGTITAVQGANGSGKSTLLNLLALLARATRGEILFDTLSPRKHPGLRGRIGILAHQPMVYPDLTGVENLLLLARFYAIANPQERVAKLREGYGLGGFCERPARTYSRGQLQRLALARAVIHHPRLLLLDEPSTGLDARSTQRLISAMAHERQKGTISILVTHDDLLAEQLSDRRVTLHNGRIRESR